MLVKKFELTSDFVINAFGVKLFRIKALIAFRDVEPGRLGGYIEKEENLDQDGDAWVAGNAWVSGDAWVAGNAWVSGDARVKKPTHLLQVGAIGSRNDFTTFFRAKNNQIYVSCGCFLGNIDEFAAAVLKKHAGTKHEKAYMLAIELAKAQIELDAIEEEEGKSNAKPPETTED